jgi:hypothetical protein
MKLPPDIQFHEDIHLLVYRPRGSLNEASVNKIIKVIGELEAKLKEPFNRFSDTLGHDEVELNFKYVIQDSCDGFHHHSLRQATCLTDARFADQGPHFPRSTGSGAMAQRADRTVNCGSLRSGAP